MRIRDKEAYEVVEELNGFYRVKISDTLQHWIAKSNAEVIEEEPTKEQLETTRKEYGEVAKKYREPEKGKALCKKCRNNEAWCCPGDDECMYTPVLQEPEKVLPSYCAKCKHDFTDGLCNVCPVCGGDLTYKPDDALERARELAKNNPKVDPNQLTWVPYAELLQELYEQAIKTRDDLIAEAERKGKELCVAVGNLMMQAVERDELIRDMKNHLKSCAGVIMSQRGEGAFKHTSALIARADKLEKGVTK